MIQRKIINRRKALKITAYLMGGAVSASLATGLIGCQTDTLDTSTDTDAKAFLSDVQNKTVTEATERILPKTNTPGAKEAKVNEFIEMMGQNILTAEEKQGLLAGIDQLEADAQAAHNQPFAALNAAQMDALITATATKNPEFFKDLRELTVLGFFTSEVGAKQALAYDDIPGVYQGCIPLEEVGNTWAM